MLRALKRNFGVFLLAAIFSFIALATASEVNAQAVNQPQFLLTWQAHGSYVPPGYADKALPNIVSPVSVSLALVINGKPVDLTNQTIYWYQDDTLIGGGTGLQYLTFTPFGGAPNFITLKVELPSYNGALLIHTVTIPLVQPKAVIEVSHPNAQFSANPLTLQATPYFFNSTDPSLLFYNWSVNGMSPAIAENPETLQLSIGPNPQSGSTFAISLAITDSTDKITASDSTNLTYIKQL